MDVRRSVHLNESIKKRKEESMKELLKDPDIHAFAKKYHMSLSELSDYWAELLDFKDDKAECAHCQGLEYCPKVSKGLCRVLEYDDGGIKTPLKFCRFGKIREEEELVLHHFLYNNVSRSLALSRFEDNQFVTHRHDLSPVNKVALANIIAYLRAPIPKGIYLSGESGSGKTVLMASVMNRLARNHLDVGICHFPSFLLDMKSSFNNSSDDSYLSHILHIPYLMLDGIGEENITSWSRDEILLTILSYREINHLATFMTSMYDIEDLDDVYLLRRNDKTEKLRAAKISGKIRAMCSFVRIESIGTAGKF